MAIKINVTANVSNIQEIRKKIEKQLQGLKLSVEGLKGVSGKAGSLVGGDAKTFKATSDGAQLYIDKLKALKLSRQEFIKEGTKYYNDIKNNNELIKEQARIVQALINVEKIETKEILEKQKIESVAIKEKLRLLAQEKELERQKAIKGTLVSRAKEYMKDSEALKQLVKDGQRGKVSTEDMVKASDRLVSSMKKQESEIDTLGGKTKWLISSRKELEAEIKNIIKYYQEENKARSKDLSASIKAQIKNEQQLTSAIREGIKAKDQATKMEEKAAKAFVGKARTDLERSQQEKAKEAIRGTINEYEKGIISLNKFIQKYRELNVQYKDLSSVKNELRQLDKALEQAEKQYLNTTVKGYEAQVLAAQKAKELSKENLRIKREEQALQAALNRIRRELTGEQYKKNIASAETYNRVLKNQIELYRARRISAQEFMSVTNRLMEQEKNLAALDNKTYGQLQANRQKATADIKRMEKEQAKANQGLNAQGAAAANANKGLKGYIANLGMIIKKFSDWILVSSIVFFPIKLFQDAIQYIREMDDALTNLNKVVELSTSQLDSMRLSAIELGKSLGVSSSEIMKSMAEFGRINKIQADIEELAKAATVAANVTTMTADEAAKAINTVMITFNKDVTEAMGIIDAFNEVQNNFRTSAEDLSESIGKVGIAARQAGIEMEDLAGYTTAIVSATGVTGSVAGTALKSVISRIYRIGTEGAGDAGKAEMALKEIGVAVRDASGEFRDFDVILSDLSSKWDGLNNVTQMNIAQVVAGTHHYSRFLGLMENMDIATAATAKAIDSENSAMDENQKHLESISGRLGTLTSTIQEKFADSLSADMIKEFISGTTKLIDIFGDLKTIVLITASVFAIWKKAQIEAWLANSRFIANLKITSVVLADTARQQGVLTAANLAAKASFDALKGAVVGLWGVISSNPITALVTAITALVLINDLWKQQQEEKIRNTEEMFDRLKKEQEIISDTNKYYRENYKDINSSDKVKQDLIATQEKLIETFGIEGKNIDLLNGNYDENIEKLRELQIEKLRLARYELGEVEKPSERKFKTPIIEEKIFTPSQLKLTTDFFSKADKDIDEYIVKLKEMRKNLYENNEEAKRWVGIGSDRRQEAIDLIDKELKKLEQSYEIEQKALKLDIELTKLDAESKYELSDAAQKAYKNLSLGLDTSNQKEYEKGLNNLLTALSSSEFEEINKRFQNLDASFSLGDISLKNYIKSVEELKVDLKDLGLNDDQINSIYKFQDGIKKIALTEEEMENNLKGAEEAYSNATERVNTLNSAISELNTEEKLSAETSNELISLYPGLADNITDVDKTLQSLIKTRNEEKKSVKETFTAYMELSEDFYSSFVSDNQEMFNKLRDLYGEDLNQFTNLQQLKTAIQNRILLTESDKTYQALLKQAKDSQSNIPMGFKIELLEKEKSINDIKDFYDQIEQYQKEVEESLKFEAAKQAAKELESIYDGLISNLNQLAGAVESLTEDEQLNAETMLDLIEKYPQLADSMGNNVALLEQLKVLHKQEAEAAKQAYVNKLANNDTFMENMINSNENFWNGLKKAYGVDLRNWADYMSLKQEMSNVAIESIGEQWNVDLDNSLREASKQLEYAKLQERGVDTGIDYGDLQEKIKLKEFVATTKYIRSELENLAGSIKWEEIGFSKDYLSGAKDKEKDVKKLSEAEIERYIKLKEAIDAVNRELEKNANLLELAQTDEEKINLLNKEVSLLKEKKIAIDAYVNALRQERSQRVKDLKTFGVAFTGEGEELQMTNIDDILAEQKAKVNKLARAGDEDLYEREKERLENLTDLYKRFLDLQKSEIPGLLNESLSVAIREIDIGDEIANIELTGFNKLSEGIKAKLKPLTDTIENLNYELSMTDSEDYAKRQTILAAIFSKNEELADALNEALKEYNHVNAQSEITQEAVNEEIDNTNQSLKENSRTLRKNTEDIEDNTKAWDESKQNEVNEAISAYIKGYNKDIQNQIDLLEELSDQESENADQRLKDNKKLIEDDKVKLDLMKDELNSLKKIREEQNQTNEIEKQKEMIINLQREKTQKVYKSGIGWTWQEDVLAVKDAQEKLKEMQDDYYIWQKEQFIDQLEESISTKEDENEEIEKQYKKEIDLLKKLFIDESDIIKDDTLIINSWDELMDRLSGYDSSFYKDSINNLKTHFSNMQTEIDKSNLDWSEYTDNLQKVKDLLTDINNLAKTKEPEKKELNKKEDKIEDFQADKPDLPKVDEYENSVRKEMITNSQRWKETKDQEEKTRLAKRNLELGERLGWTRTNGIWYTREGVPAYKNGGLVDYTGFAWLDGTKNNPERVLSSEQNKMFNSLLTNLPKIIQTNQTDNKSEIYNINIDKVVSNNAEDFVNNLKQITYSRGRGA